MKTYNINFTQSEIINLIKVCDSSIEDHQCRVLLIVGDDLIKHENDLIKHATLVKEKLINAIREKTVNEILSHIKLGDKLYDISYGGIAEVTVTTIETYENHDGKVYTIYTISDHGMHGQFTNDDINTNIFVSYDEAKDHAIFFDNHGNKINSEVHV